MGTWTSRQISGAILGFIGLCATYMQPTIMAAFASAPQFYHGLAQVTLAIVGPGFLVIGIYRFATKDKGAKA